MKKYKCLACQKAEVEILLNFGHQPPSNRFIKDGAPNHDVHPLVLAQCQSCGLIQLVDPMPIELVLSKYDWIVYNEPEGHLDKMVDDVIDLIGLKNQSLICGISYIDDTTLARFKNKGYEKIYRMNLAEDLKIQDSFAGLETIQEAISSMNLENFVKFHGKADLLMVRRVLDHAHNPRKFIQSIAQLVKLGGYMVFEIPDSTKFIEACDYSFIWEEHITYHTKDTAMSLFQLQGFKVTKIKNYSYPLEDSLVVIIKNEFYIPPIDNEYVSSLLSIGKRYAEQFNEIKVKLLRILNVLSDAGKKVVIFGAGHLSIKYLNLFGISEFIYAVIDDNEKKAGLYLPGSGATIKPSSILVSEKIDLCLLSLNPESEAKVVGKNGAYIESGGKFKSIFRLSKMNLL